MAISLTNLKELLTTYLFDVKLPADAAEKAKKDLKPDVMAAFAAYAKAGGGNVQIDTPTWQGHATYVAPGTTSEVDVEKLQELLDDETWALITTPAVDVKKLAAAAELGKVSQDIMSKVTTHKPRDGSIRFTAHRTNDEIPITVERDRAKPQRVVSRRVVKATR